MPSGMTTGHVNDVATSRDPPAPLTPVSTAQVAHNRSVATSPDAPSSR
jgi:hypothetical protein